MFGLKEGSFYKLRNGNKGECLKINARRPGHIITEENGWPVLMMDLHTRSVQFLTLEGRLSSIADQRNDNPMDVISEWVDPLDVIVYVGIGSFDRIRNEILGNLGNYSAIYLSSQKIDELCKKVRIIEVID